MSNVEANAMATSSAPTPRTATRAVVLSSGGVDSTTCLALAVRRFGAVNVCALSVAYGQRHSRELESAQAIARHYGVEHHTLDLSRVLERSQNALMAGSKAQVRHATYADQAAQAAAEGREAGPVSTYVPFRNGLMLSAAGAYALSLFPHEVTLLYLGAHADDAAGSAYPDCSPAFIQAMGSALSLGTYDQVRLEAPFAQGNKADIVRCGLGLGVPYHLTWSCYEGQEQPCGACGTCLDRIAAFDANGMTDPLMQAGDIEG
ncbi:7-cyano-7-deazaguanine synthase QueC [Berryella wangjianweii]|nr:7-cyano-7-deazaguanine synthase QueC [Berryella wangjianweii]